MPAEGPAELAAELPEPARRPAATVLMMPDYRQHNPYQALLARALEDHNCRVLFPRGYRRGLPLFRAVRDAGRVDVLHLHWIAPYVGGRSPLAFAAFALRFVVDLLLVRLSGCRLVWTMHNLVPHEARFKRLEILVRCVVCRLASAVAVHGADGRSQAIRRLRCPAGKIYVVPLGHYRDAYGPPLPRSVARRRLGLDPSAGQKTDQTSDRKVDPNGDQKADHNLHQNVDQNGRMFLFFGMLRPYKGLELLLRAWTGLRPEGSVLFLVGSALDPGYARHLAELVARAPGARLVEGFVPDDDVAAWFSAADVVVLPFEQVQTSGSLLLAMSYGKPIIAPRLGEIPEALGGADDLLYTPGCQSSLAASLQRALGADHSELAERTAAAARRFDWDFIARQLSTVYMHGTSCDDQ